MKNWTYSMLFFSVVAFQACNNLPDEVPPPDENPDTAAAYADYLVFSNAVKVQEEMPVAPPGNVAINVRDTIYTMKGHPFLARIAFRHDADQTISHFNVGISGLKHSYYYEVPAEAWQSADSISVFYMGLQPPEDDAEIDYPYTVKVYIQARTENGELVGNFTRNVTVEDPADPGKKPLWDEDMIWEWLYTAHWDYQHAGVRQVQAPDFNADIEPDDAYEFSGCCVDGTYYRAGDPIDKDGSCSDSGKYSPLYKTIQVEGPDNTIGYQYLFLFQGGNFIHYSSSMQYIFHPDQSICAEDDVFRPLATNYTKTGVYTHTQGDPNSATIRFDTQVSDPPFGPIPALGTSNIVYTDHLLVIITGLEQKSDIFYLRHGNDPVFDVDQFKEDYWQYE